MTVAGETTISGPFTLNSVTTTFAYGFKILDDDELEFVKYATADGAESVLSGYTVTGVGESSGGNVVFAVAPSGGTGYVRRKAIGTQLVNLTNTGPFFPEEVMKALDRATMRYLELREMCLRSIRGALGETMVNLPKASVRASKILSFDESGVLDASISRVDVATVAGLSDEIAALGAISADIETLAALDTELAALYAIRTAISTVSGIAANVSTVAGISSNVTTVAGISSAISTVSGIASAVSGVAAISSAVSAVNSNATNINAVAGIEADITGLLAISGDITGLFAIAADVSAVADIDSDVSAVAAVAANVSTVAGIGANVTTVAGISANVTSVAGIGANVTTVAGISSAVSTVAGISSAISTLGPISAAISTVSGIAASVSTVAAIAADVTTVAGLGVVGILNGSGTPSSGLGVNGNFYIDIADPADPLLFGPKTAGAWGSAVPLVGPEGPGGGDVLGPATHSASTFARWNATPNSKTLIERSASEMRTDLGLAIGSNVQAYSANLTTFAGIAPAANVQSVLGAADYAAIRTLLGLVIGTNVQAYNANLTTFAGIAPAANVQSVLGAADYAAIRTLLGLVIGTNVQAYDADLTTWAGLSPHANFQTLVPQTFAQMRASLDLEAGTDFLSPAAIAAAYQPLHAILTAAATSSGISGKITVSTSAPSGGSDGDLWFVREA